MERLNVARAEEEIHDLFEQIEELAQEEKQLQRDLEADGAERGPVRCTGSVPWPG